MAHHTARRWTVRGLALTAIAGPVLGLGLAQAHAADVPAELEPVTTAGTDMVDGMDTGLPSMADEDTDADYDADSDDADDE
jgi:hypothetical protein